MKILMSTLLFSSIAAISTATEVGQYRPEHTHSYGKGEHYHLQHGSTMPMPSKSTTETYFSSKDFKTGSGSVPVRLPVGLDISSETFSKSPSGDIPYILADKATQLFNKGDKSSSALYTVAAIWANIELDNFTNELEDYHPGIVERIQKLNNTSELQAVLKELRG